MEEYKVWGVLAGILAVSCLKIHAQGFLILLCVTLVALCMYQEPQPPSSSFHFPPSFPSSSPRSHSSNTSARVGEMVPNPRKQVNNNSALHSSDAGITTERNHGQASYKHIQRRSRDSHVAEFDAFLQDAIRYQGFKP